MNPHIFSCCRLSAVGSRKPFQPFAYSIRCIKYTHFRHTQWRLLAWGSFAQKPLTPAESKYEKVAIFPASYLKWVLKQNRKLSSFKTKERYTAKQEFYFIPSHTVFVVDVLYIIRFLTD
jgi:hypothetical protein